MTSAIKTMPSGRTFNSRLLQQAKSTDAGKVKAITDLRNMRTQLSQKVKSALAMKPNADQLTKFLVELESDLQEATFLFKQIFETNPNDSALNELGQYIRATQQHVARLSGVARAQISTEMGLSNDFRQFVKQASSTARMPLSGASTSRRPPNFGPSAVGEMQRHYGRRLTPMQANSPSIAANRSSISSFNTMGGGGGGGASRGSASMSQYERHTLMMNRQIFRRDTEFQEWNKNFWEGFARKLQSQNGPGGNKNGNGNNGLGWGDLIAASLGLKTLRGLKSLGGATIRGLGKGIRGVFKGMAEVVKRFRGLITGLTAATGSLNLGKLVGSLDDFSKSFMAKWQGFRAGLASMLDDARTRLSGGIGKFSTELGSKIGGWKDALSSKISGFTSSMVKDLGASVKRVNELLAGGETGLSKIVGRAVSAGQSIKATLSNYTAGIAKSVSDAAAVVSRSIDGPLAYIKAAQAKVGAAVSGGAQKVGSVVSGGAKIAAPWVQKATDIGSSVVKGGMSAIKSGVDSAKSFAAPWVSGAKTAASGFGKIAGSVLRVGGKVLGPLATPLAGGLGVATYDSDMRKVAPSGWGERIAAGFGLGVSGASLFPTVQGWWTGNQWSSGTGERALRAVYDKISDGAEFARADEVAAEILRGNKVSTDRLGTDQKFIEMVRRRIEDLADDQRKRLYLTGDFDARSMPKELATWALTPIGKEYLKKPEVFKDFVTALNHAATRGSVAVGHYWLRMQNGTQKNKSVWRTAGTFDKGEYDDYRGALDRLNKGYFDFTGTSSDKPQALPKPKPSMAKRNPFTAGADSDPMALKSILSNTPADVKFNVGGVISGPVHGVDERGLLVSLGESRPEAVFPLVRGKGGDLGVQAHTVQPKGPVTLQSEQFNITLSKDSAKAFGEALFDALAKAGLPMSSLASAAGVLGGGLRGPGGGGSGPGGSGPGGGGNSPVAANGNYDARGGDKPTAAMAQAANKAVARQNAAGHVIEARNAVRSAKSGDERRAALSRLDQANRDYASAVGAGGAGPGADGSAALTDGKGRVISTADTSMPAHQRALLDTLAMGNATSGDNYWESPDYNTIVGGRKFDSYADHPRIFGTRDSTAAGRYQFTKTTWDAVVKLYNKQNPDNPITDFSPKNQDRAAWWLAADDYRRRTGGRDLNADLQSGDPRVGALIKQGLGGMNADTTWQILQMKSAGQIQSAFDSNLARNKGYVTTPTPRPATPAAAATSAMSPADGAAAASEIQDPWYAPASGRVGSQYGMRKHPLLGVMKKHEGTDIRPVVRGTVGSPIYSARGGTVKSVTGSSITIDHGNGYETTYRHLSGVNVKPGDKVTGGAPIGAMGNAGLSTAPHLHFEMKKDGAIVDPASVIPDLGVRYENSDKMLAGGSAFGAAPTDPVGKSVYGDSTVSPMVPESAYAESYKPSGAYTPRAPADPDAASLKTRRRITPQMRPADPMQAENGMSMLMMPNRIPDVEMQSILSNSVA